MPRQLLNIKNFINEFLSKLKNKKKKLKTIKYINSDLINLDNNTQEHNHKFKHQHKNIKYKPRTKHKKHKLKFKH